MVGTALSALFGGEAQAAHPFFAMLSPPSLSPISSSSRPSPASLLCILWHQRLASPTSTSQLASLRRIPGVSNEQRSAIRTRPRGPSHRFNPDLPTLFLSTTHHPPNPSDSDLGINHRSHYDSKPFHSLRVEHHACMADQNAAKAAAGNTTFTDAQVEEYREQDRWLPVSTCGSGVCRGQKGGWAFGRSGGSLMEGRWRRRVRDVSALQ